MDKWGCSSFMASGLPPTQALMMTRKRHRSHCDEPSQQHICPSPSGAVSCPPPQGSSSSSILGHLPLDGNALLAGPAKPA